MKSSYVLGIILTLISAFCYAVISAIVKSQISNIPTPVMVFLQSLFTLLVCLPFAITQSKGHIGKFLKTEQIGQHFLRAIVSQAINYFLFLSIAFIPLVNAVLLVNTAPLLVPIIAYLIWKKKINHRLWIPMLVGFLGIALVLHPDPSHAFDIHSMLAFAGGVAMALSSLLVKRLRQRDDSLTISFYYFLFGTIISLPLAWYFWQPLSTHLILIMAGVGVLFFIVQYTLTIAIHHTSPELAMSLYYSYIVFTALLSWIIWRTPLSILAIVGIILTCTGGILCILEQRQSKS